MTHHATLLLLAAACVLAIASPAHAYTLTCAKARWAIHHSPRHIPGKWWRELHCHRVSAHRVHVGYVHVWRHRGHVYDLSWPGCRCRRVR